jgi:ubiquitin C-terminal hydrolase
LPRTLIVVISRTRAGDTVQVPDTIALSGLLQDHTRKYTLGVVVCHVPGHYYAYARPGSDNDEWERIDDERCVPVESRTVHRDAARCAAFVQYVC